MGQLLNDVIKDSASRFGWRYVDGIANAFNGHGYCAQQSYFRFAGVSCDMQGDFDGTMHPNEDGQRSYANEISRVLKEQLRARWEERPDVAVDPTHDGGVK